ncbi:hypothetical protein Rs2_01810 [Raphanus sativus]|nr:Uncharacterized protein Rs2_43495 [Raphanus sativus]KAJ4909138.1 hypothetical protein Rs2_03759 [Raphanus sativus]KAJ4916260.1 hypothetical protein Rs2_01810 [Raphanus sativus]
MWLRPTKVPAFQVSSPITTFSGGLCQKPTNLILFKCLVLTNLILVLSEYCPWRKSGGGSTRESQEVLANMVWVREEVFLDQHRTGLVFDSGFSGEAETKKKMAILEDDEEEDEGETEEAHVKKKKPKKETQ